MRKLQFDVDSIKLKEEIENSQFVRARARIFASGDNAHGMPVLESALHKAESTIYEKPLVWKYDRYTNDAASHEVDEVPCGFVPRLGANIAYERDDDGRLFFVCDILLWRFYSGKILEIFAKTENEKSVSVEIAVLETDTNDSGTESIAEYSYMAITVIGEKYTPAVPGANIILQFSEDKVVVEDILQQSFAQDIPAKEVDLVVFDKMEFAQKFSLTANEMWELLATNTRELKYQEEDSDYQYTRYWMRDYDNAYIYAYDDKENKLCAIPYSMDNNVPTIDYENVKPARLTYIVSDEYVDNIKEFAKEVMTKEFSSIETEVQTYKEQVSVLEAEKVTMSEAVSTLTQENETLKTENVELKGFKANVEKQAIESKMEYAISAVSDDLTPDQVDEWRNKFAEFTSVDEFSNAIKAFAYEVTKGKARKSPEEVIRVSIPDLKSDNNKPKSIWERI